METNNDRSNQQGQNFGDIENEPKDMATPNAENKPAIDVDKINDDFLANDTDKDTENRNENRLAAIRKTRHIGQRPRQV